MVRCPVQSRQLPQAAYGRQLMQWNWKLPFPLRALLALFRWFNLFVTVSFFDDSSSKMLCSVSVASSVKISFIELISLSQIRAIFLCDQLQLCLTMRTKISSLVRIRCFILVIVRNKWSVIVRGCPLEKYSPGSLRSLAVRSFGLVETSGEAARIECPAFLACSTCLKTLKLRRLQSMVTLLTPSTTWTEVIITVTWLNLRSSYRSLGHCYHKQFFSAWNTLTRTIVLHLIML